ncbi:MAG: hypothetical protein KAQ65_08320, partial [Candidatus Thorarchaeota archaeon]|nr:hypothetical protein [Candidatus Thorarchaeota archaeon]
VSFSLRKKYTVKSVFTDLKKINPTPAVTYLIGNRLVYYQWNICCQALGADHPISKNFNELLEFLQKEFEAKLVRGDFWRAADTPNAAINQFLKDRPDDFLNYVYERPSEYIHGVIVEVAKMRKAEIKKYKKIEKGLRMMIKDSPKDSDLWNQLRLVLWIIEKYKDASSAFKTAQKFGWNSEETSLVAM